MRLKNEHPPKDDAAWTCDPRALMAGMSALYDAEESVPIDTLREDLAYRAVHRLAEWNRRSHFNVQNQTPEEQEYAHDLDELIKTTPAIARDLLTALARQHEKVVAERDSLKKERDKLKKEVKSLRRPAAAT